MKKSLTIFFLLFGFYTLGFSQFINGYKYVIVDDITYKSGEIDVYDISSELRKVFNNKGYEVLYKLETWPIEAQKNICLILRCTPFTEGASTVSLKMTNCKNEVVYRTENTSANWANDYSDNYKRALKKCLNPIERIDYSYDSTVTPEFIYPNVEKTNDNEETIKNYLSSNKLDNIEGIYQSFQSDSKLTYRFGIIKKDNVYKAIIIESDLIQWKAGEVKAVFEKSSVKDIYSTNWFNGNKQPYQTFANMENDALLAIEFNYNKEKTYGKFIKMYPPLTRENTPKKNESVASGSGFFISTDGIIGTNAHVIKDASKIEVTISNEIGTFIYNAKLLLQDMQNDVALIKIDDEKFKGLSSIPYSFNNKADVGGKVFTIGYPLNDVMGSNYKVTDGIISAQSGIGDDMRYYQISVPLQPGNSGGPLFDMNGRLVGITTAKLNGDAIGTTIENVNYAIKISYLTNLYSMLPNSNKLNANQPGVRKELSEQVKVLKNYVCLIKIY
jgi:S1-C subfamily serine protease